MNIDAQKLRIAEHAAEWLIRLETATAEERDEFWKWLCQSPLHVKEMLAAQACHVHLLDLFRDKRIDADALRSADNVHPIENCDDSHAGHDTPTVAPVFGGARLRKALTGNKRVRWTIAAAAAACVIALSIVAVIAIQTTSASRLTTDVGEWQTKILDDGSILRAGPRTKAIVEFTDGRRVVHLSRGEALFHVAKNPKRPFLVETEFATARAVGTAFGVSLEGSTQVRVTVKEGTVAVTRRVRARPTTASDTGQSITLKAGEQVAVSGSSPLALQHVDLETAFAWASGRLIFEHETVEQAVQEFNRRNSIQIKVLDHAFLQRPVRGVFAAADPESFATYLETQGAVAMMDKDSGTLLITTYSEDIARK
jgi:transmembrane sensor